MRKMFRLSARWSMLVSSDEWKLKLYMLRRKGVEWTPATTKYFILNIFDVTFNFRFSPGYDACSMRTTSLATKRRIFHGSSQGLQAHADGVPMSCVMHAHCWICFACISPWLVSNMILIWRTHATFSRSLLNVRSRAPHYRRAFHIIIATQRFNNAWKLKSC